MQVVTYTRLDAKLEGEKVLLRKIASSILNCCPRIAFASNLSFVEEEAWGANLHIKVALVGGKSKKL